MLTRSRSRALQAAQETHGNQGLHAGTANLPSSHACHKASASTHLTDVVQASAGPIRHPAASCEQDTAPVTRTAGRRRTRGADTGRQQDGSRLPQTPQRQAGTSAPPLGDPGTPWQKVLWKRQARADNYTDASFLEALVVNAGVQPVRRYRPIVLASLALAQQLCTVVAAVAIPAHLRYGSLSVGAVLGACAVLLVCGYLVCALLGGHLLGGSVIRGLRQCILLVFGVLLLSPLLRSLAATVSEDSVLSLSCVALLLHLFLHDYHFVNSVTDRFSGAVALSSAVMASVLLASLMHSDLAAFAQVLFSLEVYLLWPYARRYIHRASTLAHACLTLLMSLAAAALLWPLSPVLAALLVITLALVIVVCPWWLVSSHKFKAKINGPWDEAVPHIPHELQRGASLHAT